MSLTKKHFKEIAEILKEARSFPIEIRETDKPIINNIDLIINKFSDYFKTLNPLFDETKFKEACL
jgi:hypothetical protein